jgi:hypothetical protein
MKFNDRYFYRINNPIGHRSNPITPLIINYKMEFVYYALKSN